MTSCVLSSWINYGNFYNPFPKQIQINDYVLIKTNHESSLHFIFDRVDKLNPDTVLLHINKLDLVYDGKSLKWNKNFEDLKLNETTVNTNDCLRILGEN